MSISSKAYEAEHITIIWKPGLCAHSANCVNGLPQVFDFKAKPWINAHGTEAEAIAKQTHRCPSGALSHVWNDGRVTESELLKMETVEVQVRPKGPYELKGRFEIRDGSGNLIEIKEKVSLCRCGKSKNKPFCDGTHHHVEFDS
ncbi:MAG: (4Fe-4S)-binding protein [Bacteroidetes bacterium]|nr:(4Fe-4S)-binding protein [Bacteroidota bacterium]